MLLLLLVFLLTGIYNVESAALETEPCKLKSLYAKLLEKNIMKKYVFVTSYMAS